MKMKQLGWVMILGISITFGMLCVIPAFSVDALPRKSHSSWDLTDKELEEFKGKANAGDANAAWRVHLYYALELHEPSSSQDWMNRAAKLGYAEAQRCVAYSIWHYGKAYQEFGQTPQQAVLDLLEKASKSSSSACRELGDAYAEGYFGAADLVKARAYYEQAAQMGNSMAWRKMAEYCHRGTGGSKDEPMAYYWISLEARCVHPKSIGGKETWQLRNEVAALLTRAQFEEIWKRIDAYIAEVRSGKVKLDSPPFGKGSIDPKISEEGERLADQLESEHREQIRKKFTPQ